MLPLASSSLLVGDAELVQQRVDGSERSEWLLHTEAAKAHLQANPGQFLDAALLAASGLKGNGWLDDETAEVQLKFSSYNEWVRMFSLTEVRVNFNNLGVVRPKVVAAAVLSDPYPVTWVYVLDVAYIILILVKLRKEAYDMCSALRLGCGEFVDYWNVWNVIDWADVMLGWVGIAAWIVCCQVMLAPSLMRLIQKPSHELAVDPMALSELELAEIHQNIHSIRQWFLALHLVFAANLLAIMAKFFKAFESNPRLKVVTDTLAKSFQDIVHFLVVFLTVFLSFAVIGHVLFGSDIVEFYTTSSAINTGFVILMGEFSWYVDIQSATSDILPSGMPHLLVNIWFFAYMFFVLLVLLNMLLAIILGRYADVTMANSGSQTIWQQCREYVRFHTATRGFVPLHRLRLLLENDRDPAHPARIVTVESLLDAFPKMTTKQAEWILQWLDAEVQKEIKEDEHLVDGGLAQDNERLIHGISWEVGRLSKSVQCTTARLNKLEATLTEFARQHLQAPS